MTPEEIHLCWDYAGDGYGIPTRESAQMIQILARTEGIFLDPVYTSKAIAGLVDWIKTGPR